MHRPARAYATPREVWHCAFQAYTHTYRPSHLEGAFSTFPLPWLRRVWDLNPHALARAAFRVRSVTNSGQPSILILSQSNSIPLLIFCNFLKFCEKMIIYAKLHCRSFKGPIVYRLGRQVFILESGVRFPVGPQKTYAVAWVCEFTLHHFSLTVIEIYTIQ